VAATWGSVKRAWHAQHPVLAAQAPGVRSPRGHASSLTLGAYNNFFFQKHFFNNNNNDNCYYYYFQFSSILNINTFNYNKENNI
jgi:hypothetical protein